MSAQELVAARSHYPIPAWPLAVLRIATGVMFLMPGFDKVFNRGIGGFSGAVAGFAERGVAEAPRWYALFLEHVVLAAPTLFAVLVAWGELLMAIALIIGAGARFAAWVGLLLMLNFHFGKGIAFWDAGNYDAIWALVFLLLGACAAGRVFGLDHHLTQRWRWWRWLG